MKAMIEILNIPTLVPTDEIKPTITLIMSAILLSVHRLFGSMEFASETFGASSDLQPALFMFGTAFLLLGLIPLAIIVFGYHEHPKSYGLRLGNWKLGLGVNCFLFPVIALTLLYPASQTGEVRAFFPFSKGAGDSAVAFLSLQGPRIFLFYTAWEFFFRGFMLFSLRRNVGDWLAICIQTIPQCLWHIGMPAGEMLSSIAAGVLFGILAIRTNSIVWPLMLHCLIGVVLDILILTTS
jgi:membrane protease YdiL (CAAX protease family)